MNGFWHFGLYTAAEKRNTLYEKYLCNGHKEVNRNDNNKIRQEILDSGYDGLTDEEHDHQQYLKELIQSGYYALYHITLVDMVEVMRRKGFHYQ